MAGRITVIEAALYPEKENYNNNEYAKRFLFSQRWREMVASICRPRMIVKVSDLWYIYILYKYVCLNDREMGLSRLCTFYISVPEKNTILYC